MQNDVAMLHCPNDLCKAPNRQTDKFCQRCGTLLVKRYLWTVGEGIEAYKLGDLVADRYLLTSSRIVLDTKPALLPETPTVIADEIQPYLRLVGYRLQLPQVYGLLSQEVGKTAKILLLEQAAIYTDDLPHAGQLMPELTNAWKEASSLRQLNWLWQIATLWQPLSTEGVVSSLLDTQLLRVEGALVRLRELQLDGSSTPVIADLGHLWKSQLLPGAQKSIAEFIENICHLLLQGEVHASQHLVAILDLGLAELGRSQKRTLKISTCTDTGPSRQRNEDACYPASGTTTTIEGREARDEGRGKENLSPQASSPELTRLDARSPSEDLLNPRPSPHPSGTPEAYVPRPSPALAIVCDGIGGHQGGNVASNLAIETIQQQVQRIRLDDIELDATTLSDELENAACVANDRISERNDNEKRHGRQRMGTTLVMALARAHEIYITHVGDSRAYWITRNGCHQITLDDDVASREVRLGYAVYRDAVQQVSSGSLVQALGMSSVVHPTVQRFIVDEDCVFLLCSDGLSDYDRVEQFWETEILPILENNTDVTTAVARLVEIANNENGHDNVTVGLLHCKVSFSEPEATLSPCLATLAPPSSTSVASTWSDDNNSEPPDTALSKRKTQLLPSRRRVSRFNLLAVFLGLILLLSLGGGLAYWFIPIFRDTVRELANNLLVNLGMKQIAAPDRIATSPSATSPVPRETLDDLEENYLIKINRPIPLGEREKSPLPSPNAPNQVQSLRSTGVVVEANTVLKVLKIDRSPDRNDWIRLVSCSNLDHLSIDQTKPEQEQNQADQSHHYGWVRKDTLISNLDPNYFPHQAAPSDCPAPPISVQPNLSSTPPYSEYGE